MGKIKYSKEIKEKAILLYSNGKSISQVGKALDINKSTITNWLREANVIRKISSPAKPELKQKAVELYLSGLNTTEIGDILNAKKQTVLLWLRSCNIKRRHKGPKSKINKEDFFDNIDNEKKAYYLGWIMADGNISITNGQYSLKFNISYNDKELIDNFLLDIESRNKASIKDVGDKKYYYVSLTSVHMIKSLIKHGVIPKKSGKEVVPNIDEDLMHHFVRGYFDGDGITDIQKYKRSGFIAPYEVLKYFDNIVGINKPNLIRKAKTEKVDMFYILYGKKDSKILFDYLYKDSTIFLARKHNRMNIICNNTEVTEENKKSLEP